MPSGTSSASTAPDGATARPSIAAMLHVAVEEAFHRLLGSWRHHWSIQRRPGVALDELADSRRELDRSRERMRRLRLAVHPEPSERDGVVDSVWCEALGTVVHLRWVDRDPGRPGNLRCPCGGLVPIDWSRIDPPARSEPDRP